MDKEFAMKVEELWSKIEPYIEYKEKPDALNIRDDAPPEVVKAAKELYRIGWEDLSQ